MAGEMRPEGAAAAAGDGEALAVAGDREALAAATGDREAIAAAGGGPAAGETARRASVAALITPRMRISNRHQNRQNRSGTH